MKYKVLFIAPISALHGQGRVSNLALKILYERCKLIYFDTHVKDFFSYILITVSLLQFLIKNRNQTFNYLYFTPSRSNPGVLRDIILFIFLYCGIINCNKIYSHLHGSDHKEYYQSRSLYSLLWLWLSREFSIHYILLSKSHCEYTYLKDIDQFSIITNPSLASSYKLYQCRKDIINNCLFISFPHPDKGLDKSVNFCSKYALKLTVIGWTKEDFKQAYKRKPPTNVLFKGVMSNSEISNELAEYDLLLLPSFYKSEAQPLVVIDALCSFIPVLISRHKMLKDFECFKGVNFIENYNHSYKVCYSKNQHQQNVKYFSIKTFTTNFISLFSNVSY